MLLILLTLFTQANADYGRCTAWQAQEETYCYFANKPATFWYRHCESIYDYTTLCSPENPNHFRNHCSSWFKTGFSCIAANGRLQQEWLRSCTRVGLQQQICSDDLD